MKRTEEKIEAIVIAANRRITEIALEACDQTEDWEQRYFIMVQIAAVMFGACGAQFQHSHPGSNKDEAAMETLKVIGGIMQKSYTQ